MIEVLCLAVTLAAVMMLVVFGTDARKKTHTEEFLIWFTSLAAPGAIILFLSLYHAAHAARLAGITSLAAGLMLLPSLLIGAVLGAVAAFSITDRGEEGLALTLILGGIFTVIISLTARTVSQELSGWVHPVLLGAQLACLLPITVVGVESVARSFREAPVEYQGYLRCRCCWHMSEELLAAPESCPACRGEQGWEPVMARKVYGDAWEYSDRPWSLTVKQHPGHFQMPDVAPDGMMFVAQPLQLGPPDL